MGYEYDNKEILINKDKNKGVNFYTRGHFGLTKGIKYLCID